VKAPVSARSAVPGEGLPFRERVRRALRIVRTMIGEPDYDRYVAHMREHHPGCEIASRDDFMQQRMESRYSKPGARCC
jgi:uncharacterized short protein YbdD (DUF466 family)